MGKATAETNGKQKEKRELTPPATLLICSPSAKKSGEARKQAGKKKKGCGENEFLPCGVGAFPQFLRQQEGKTENFSFP